MCQERRRPQTVTSAAISHGNQSLLRIAQTTEMTVSPTPQVTSTIEARSTRRATTAVIIIASTATANADADTTSSWFTGTTLSPRALVSSWEVFGAAGVSDPVLRQDAAMTSLVRYEVADALATITLDSQHNRNALS